MFDEQDRQYFYNEFKSNGYEVGSYDDFKKDLNNKEDRDWYYNEAKNMGYDVGTQADFDKMVLEPAASAPSGGGKQVVASARASKPQVAQPKTEYPQEVLDAYNSPDNKPGNFKDLAQLNDEYQRGELKKPGFISQALGMMPKVDAGNIGKEQKVGGMIANMLLGDNMQQPQQTQQPQDNNQQVQQQAQKEASPESKEETPVAVPTGVVNNEGLMDAKLANYLENWKQRPDKQGTYFENMVADLLADGTANSNEEAVQMVQSALGRYANRSAMDVTNQVVASLPDDTVQDAEKSIEAQWYSHGVQDKLKQEADSMGISYDDYVGQFLKPAMVQSLVNKYGPNYRDIAEGIATRLYSHDEHVQDRLMNQDINEALSDVISKYTSTSVAKAIQDAESASNAQMAKYNEQSKYVDAASPFAIGAIAEANKTRDPQKILGDLQKKFGKLYRNPEFLNDMSNATFKVMQRYGLNGTLNGDPKQFKPMINAAIKNELDQLEVKGMIPRGSADYILKTGIENTIIGKVSRKLIQTDYQNWLEDMANQQYQPGFWENVASGALTFAGDAWSYWLPGAAGGKLTKSMIAKAEGKLAGDLMAKGMERKVAERAAKVLIGKSKDVALKNGAVHGAVTFGGQSAISKPIDEVYRTGQFDENGKVYNPSVGKVIANTLGEVAKQSAVGAIMQGGTIANMIGKGRGLATNILADVGGKVVDSGIMTGHQMLERMAQDPNFKPTGKDAAESFLESMANLTAIGLPGMVGKYARFKDAREFNKKFDFTDQDIAELKRFGYDGLRDAFEKVGIGEYAVEGENAQRLDGQLTQKYMNLMNDKSVPEVLKAKMMAVVEGKRPSSFSPVIDSEVYRGDDGKYYLETYNKDGGVIDRKEYSSHDAARNDEKKMEYEKTLGLASVLEGEFHNEFTQEHLDGLYNKAAQKYNMGEKLTDEDKAAVYLHQNAGAIKEIMDKQQKGIVLTEEEQKQVNAYRHYYDSALENSSVMREFVNTFEDSHGVARGTLRKALESKDKKYAPLVESYLKELYNSIELKREMKQTVDDLYNTAHGNEQKRIEQSGVEGEKPAAPVEGAAPLDGSAGGKESAAEVPPTEPPTPPVEGETASNESKSDAYVMGQNAYQNGDAEGLKAIDHNDDVSKARLKRAFADDEAQMNVVMKAYEDGKDMEQFLAQRSGYMTPAQQDAVRKYVEAQDAKNGVYDALQHADDGYGEVLKEQLWPYQTEDGNIVPATLTTGQQVFLKKANEYGGGFVVVPGEDGNPTIKQVSSADIKEVGTPIPMDDYINQKFAEQVDARYKQFFAQYDGSGLKPSDTVEVAMEAGDEPMQMTFAGYSEDGKIVLSDGKDNIALTKDEFNAWRQNALDASIGAELDAEDAQRANDDAAKAEADKQERYKKGIVGLGMGQPDYSSKDTEPKVAAEYLQEQYGEDHGKLLNLVNGSRDDIKTQLASKKKAAAEYQDWLDTNADLDPEKAKKVENDLALVNEQIADLDARFKNWNTIRNSVMTPEEVKAMKEERKAEVEKAGVDETAIVPSDDFHVLVLDDKELKKQYPSMDEASDYITSQRNDIYHTQEDVEHKINDVNGMLEQYINGETELDPTQLMELNTTKAQLEALQTNLSVAAKGLKAQANKLSKLYKTEVSQQEMEELGMTSSEQRKALVADALKKNDLGAIKEIYKDSSVDVTDLTPQTLEEAVSESLRPHSLNPESLQEELGKSNFKFGIGKGYDSNKFNYLIAKKGTGMSVNDFAVKVYNDLPVNLQDMGYTDQDVRNALLDMFKSYDSVKEMKNVALMNRIAAAEDELSSEEEYYEAQKEREIIERQAEIENYKSYINEKELSLPSESELDHINGLEFDRMMEIEDRDREYKQYVKSILPELADYDDRSNEEGYGGGSSLGSDSSRRGVDEGNSQGEEVGNGEASSESEIGEGSDSGRKGRQETGSMEPGEGSAVRGSHLPQEASFGERLKSAIAETETEPTEAQKKAGNYKKGHLSFGGYDYTVETPKGVTRSGKDEQGKPWSVTMHDTYGYILGKIGVDGDHIDMFINDAADLDSFDGNVYVVDQVNPETGEFDEHKVMYGYPSEEAATEAYLANYSKDWKGLGKVTAVPKATFDKWLESSDRKTKPFADYAMVRKEQAKTNNDFIAQMEYDYENDIHPSEEDKPKMQKFAERLLNFHSDKEDKTDSGYTILSSNIQGDKLYPNEKKWFGSEKYRKGVSWVDKQNNCAYEVNPRFNNRGYLSAVGVHKIVPLMKFDRNVKEVKPSDMTEAQKVAYDAVSTMLKKAGIPVKVVSNEDMEKVAEAQDNLNLAMLLNQPELRFKIKTPEEKQAAENAYNFAKELRPDKWKQYAVVDMSNPNKMPEYFEKQELARKERSYYNKLMWGNYKVFNLDKSFEDNVAGLTGSFPSEFDPYKIDAQTSKRNELKKQIKETEEAYKLTGQERKEYQNQLMKEYMDEHGLASENDIPDDVWREFDYKAVEKYQDKLDSLFAKYKDLDRQLKAVAEPGVRFLRTYHGSQASFDNFDHSFMGSGEGAQAYGWGTYVSEVEGIAKAYAKSNATIHSDNGYKEALYKYREADFNYHITETSYKNSVKNLKEKEQLAHPKINNLEKELEEAKSSGDTISVGFLETALKNWNEVLQTARKEVSKYEDTILPNDKDVLEKAKKRMEELMPERNLYSVDIPDDTGRNYIGWDEPLGAAKIMRLPKVFKADGWEYKKVGQYDTYKIDGNEHEVWLEPSLTTGKELYRDLTNALGSDKAASEFLTKAGFVGVKVIAQRNAGGNKDGKMNYVIFDENNAQIVDHTKFAQGKGVVYGYTDGKEIVLNQEHLNANTPIHEYQHLWRTAAKKMNPELIEHGDKLIMQTQLFADLKEDPNYKHLSDDEICDEAFARLTGEDGAAILEQMANDAIKENPLDTAKELTIINRLKNWLKKFWYWTLDTFTKWKPEDIKKMTLEDIRNLVLRDLANGVDPRTKLHEAENADDIKFMGSTTKKRMKDISTQLEGRELDEAQQAVADVYSGKKDNVSLTVEREDGSNKIIMRQGNDNHAGTKHSVFRHYGVKANSVNVNDLLLIPTVLKEGERKVSDNGRIAYVYVDPTSQVKYTVVTEPKNNKEFFNDFYSNKKANPSETSRVVENSTNTPEGAHNNDGNAFTAPSDASHVAEGNTYTPEGARKTDGNAFTAAKVDNNSETAKGNDENLSVEDKIKAVSQQFGVDEADVAMYANAVKKGSTAEAARARANIKRHLMQVNEGNIFSFKDVVKYTKPINEALKENFGDLDAMIEERIKQVEAERNAMEAARKRAEEEEAKRQKHLEELSLIPDDQLDKQYMDALAKGDDATAREMLDEAARRKGYDDTESAYQGVGAWAAPGNPGYESDKARRDDWESSGSDVNLEDMAMGYTPQPDDYFSHPERYSQNTPHGLESVKAINEAIEAIKNGEKDVKVKVYRAVPTSVKEGKLRNGDWVTPSKKYAEMHGTNRLEGKYRIIEDEVPANQLWWDGNDANEFGFDDGKAYKYKNAKNNRKLNDLVTYDDEGGVIPPSKRFNSRKSDVRFHRVTEVKSPIVEQKLKKHPDSLMKAGTYFSGGGLVEEGLKGIIDPVVAVEYDRKISGVYRNNFGQHIVTADVRDVDPKELVKHIDGEVEYFHASPVCKNYSQAKSNGGEVELDKETAKSTADFIEAVKPRVVTIENVKGYKDSEAMKIITQALDKNGYKWDADVYNAADFGGYTSRERLIVRAVKDGELPEKPKKQPRKGGWLEAVEDILPTLTEKKSGVAPWMDARLKVDGIDWQKVEKPLYVMGSAYADGKIPHAYGDEILPTLRTKSGDVIIMPGGKVLRADGRVLARITGLGDDYLLPKTESLAHTIIGNGIPVQLTKGVIAPLLNKDDLSGRNVLARLGSSIFKNNWDADMQKQVSDRVVNTANKLGGAEATVYTSVDEVPDAYLSDVKNGATGWYDPTTHTVHVYLPNCADANEAERTVLHEKIGHEGMELLLGGENEVRKFANFVYRSASKDVRGKIIDFANKYDPDWKNNDRMNVGTQEYIAHLAEEGPKTAEDFTLWTKIKHYLIKVLKKLGVRVPGLLNDKDLRYYLMKAGKALHVWDEMPQEKQEAMMKQASNAEIKDALGDGAGKGKPRQKKGESAIQYMKRVMEWKRWKEAREDENDPEPPMFYDFDKDAEGKKEWERLNKEWRDSHHLQGDEMPIKPERKEGETDEAFFTRYKEWEKWNDAMADKENPMPDMFSFEKAKQDEARQKYEDWLTRHELNEQNDADLDLYEGKVYPAETNPEADALEQRVMQDLAEVTSTDVSKEGAAKTVKHAVIHRRKNMEEASADDAIYINDVKNRIEKMADSGAFDKLLSDYKGKPNRAEKLAEAIPYIIEAPRRLRDLAHDLNATGAFDKGHIHIQPDDVEAIQPFVADLIAETAKKHTVLKDDKEVEVYDDPLAVGEVASKMAQAINANHQGEEAFVPIDGSDIMSEHVLPLVMQQIVPEGIDYKNLSPEMKATLDSIRDWYNYTYDWLKDNRTLREDTGYNADYVNHIWDKEKSDKQAYALYVENRQRTKSPNEKPRTISTLMEGISVGLVPKTTDITKMMAYYSRSNIEAWGNKTMLQELSGLNVIERKEDGEIVSSDPLLSSTPPFNLEQYQYFEIPGVGPVWVYNVSPKQVKVKNPITGKERVLYSEASAGDRFGVVFETYQSSPFWKAFDTLASSAKKLELGFSGFHAGALTEVYMVQNMVEFGPKKAMANFMKYIFTDTAKNHELPCFANPQDFQEAATHLVKFGATNDYAAADVQNMFDNMRDAMIKVQEKLRAGNGISGTVALASMPLKVATQMLSLINKGMDRALWDFLHDGLKLATYRMRADKTKERAKKKGWTEEELSRALDEDGQFVNDMFGGQHWDILGASHRTLRYAGRVLLSPDWNASTTRHFLALTGYGSIWNEATFENFKHYYKRLGHGILTPEDEGRRSRQISSLLCYGIGFMVFYEAIANGINAAFRAMDEEKERKKAEEIRKTNPSYRSPYELAYPDGMKWYDYLMRGNSLGQQSKIYLGRYADGTEMYIRHGKQFREVPEYLFNHKGELEFPGPMVQRMIGKANPMVRMTLDNINYLSDFQASHADQEILRKYGKTIGLLYKDALYWAPFLIPSQENKEFKAVDFFFPSSKGFSPWKAQSYFKDFILSGDMEGVVMTYQSCQRNGIDPEAQIKAAIGSVKALESAEMSDGVTSLQEASKRFDAAKSITEKKKMRQKMKKFLSQSEYKAFTQKEALDMVQGYLNGDEDLKEMEKAESKYLMKAKAEDVTEDWRIQNVWNGTMETYQEYQRLKDVDKAKANAFKNSKTNKRLFAARKAISAAKKKMDKAKKQMDGQNDAAKLVEIRKTRKELLETLNGME